MHFLSWQYNKTFYIYIMAEVFIYTEGAVAPRDVVRVRVHPSVTAIPASAFLYQSNFPEDVFRGYNKLEEVELCEGLLEIGMNAFRKCKALKRIKIPKSVTVIRYAAFEDCGGWSKLNFVKD